MNPQLSFFLNKSLEYIRVGNYHSAELLLKQSLKIARNNPDVLRLLGVIEAKKENHQNALKYFKEASQFAPKNGIIYSNIGNVYESLKRYDEALAFHEKSISLAPSYAEAYSNKGNLLFKLKRYDEALASHKQAISLSPAYAEAHSNLGNVLFELKRYNEALASHKQAISLAPSYAAAYSNKGNVLFKLKRYDEALICYEQAVGLHPDIDWVFGDFLHLKMIVCSWNHFQENIERLIGQVQSLKKVTIPFPLLALTDDALLLKKSSEIAAQYKHPFNPALGEIKKSLKREKIRVGYFSADFRNHAVSILTAELFEQHNKNQFEIIAFSFGIDDHSPMRLRLSQAFNQFIDVSDMTDEAIAKLSRDLEIDIAVDLGGLTIESRTGIFAYRAAPIQVSYLGYLGTMGSEYIDYLIADEIIIPKDSEQYYSEKIAYIPSYQINDRKRVISDKQFTRQELGLPETGFIFCCFNNNYKILPSTFDGWMRILKAVEGSVLFLYAENPWAETNLKQEAEIRGVSSKKLIFGKHLPSDEYLARYHACDLFLDTAPYNAGTTASDALWAGLPVLTLIGKSFASRVAASLLNAIKMPELIATTQASYESLAIELATNPQKITAIKQKLADQRLSTPLFDTPLFTKNLESAYTQMMEKYWADIPPEHIYI